MKPLSDPEIVRFRKETPGCSVVNHLNNAGAALMPSPVVEAVRNHLERETLKGGYEAAAENQADISATWDVVASLLGTQARNVAVVENATVGFSQAMSSFTFEPGDVIVTSRNDYVSNQILYLSLQRRHGVVIQHAADLPEGGIDPDSVRYLVTRHRTKLVAVTWVPTNSGLVQDVEATGAVCEAADVPFIVDACQAVGQLPIDVQRLHCDFLSATARKFLRGPRGIGFLYVSDRVLERGAAPLFPDMRGATWTSPESFELTPDARRFENWEFAYGLVSGLGAAARYAQSVGVESAGHRAAALAERLRKGLRNIEGVDVLDRGGTLCAIVSIQVKAMEGAVLHERLRQDSINTSVIKREFALLDLSEKGVSSGIRLSPHYYNTEAEIDLALDAIATSIRR